MTADLSAASARRIAIAAQGLATPRPKGPVTRAHLARVLATVGIVQIDSVNVVTRSHYLPFFSRLGAYDPTLLDGLRDGGGPGSRARRGAVEYWTHEAGLVEPSTWPLFGFRMRAASEQSWGGMRRVAAEHPELVRAVEEEIRRTGPATARAIESSLAHDLPRQRTDWGWNWSLVKNAAEHLFWAGRVTSAGRTKSFERRYAALETVLPADVVDAGPHGAHPVTDEDAFAALLELAARAHGVASLSCLRDYARLRPAQAEPALRRLLDEGRLVPVTVQGWAARAYLHVDARIPARVNARALLSPFDSFVWTRPRIRGLFDFDFRLEIYTPAADRRHGYYVLPFLLRDRLVGRVDLKAERPGALRVVAVHWEPSAPVDAAEELTAELAELARFLGLEAVTGVVTRAG